jgi:hypothetical protein
MHENNSPADALALDEGDPLASSADRPILHPAAPPGVLDCHLTAKAYPT